MQLALRQCRGPLTLALQPLQSHHLELASKLPRHYRAEALQQVHAVSLVHLSRQLLLPATQRLEPLRVGKSRCLPHPHRLQQRCALPRLLLLLPPDWRREELESQPRIRPTQGAASLGAARSKQAALLLPRRQLQLRSSLPRLLRQTRTRRRCHRASHRHSPPLRLLPSRFHHQHCRRSSRRDGRRQQLQLQQQR